MLGHSSRAGGGNTPGIPPSSTPPGAGSQILSRRAWIQQPCLRGNPSTNPPPPSSTPPTAGSQIYLLIFKNKADHDEGTLVYSTLATGGRMIRRNIFSSTEIHRFPLSHLLFYTAFDDLCIANACPLCGKREAYINYCSMVVTENKAAPFTGITLRTYWPRVPSDSGQWTLLVRNFMA